MNVMKKDAYGNQGARGKMRRPMSFHANPISFLPVRLTRGEASSKTDVSSSQLSSAPSTVMSSSQCSSASNYAESPLSLSASQSSIAERQSKHGSLRNDEANRSDQFNELMAPFLLFRDGDVQSRQTPSSSGGQTRQQLRVSFEDENFSPLFKKPKLFFDDSGRKSRGSAGNGENDLFRVLASASNVSDSFSAADLRVPVNETDVPMSSQVDRDRDDFFPLFPKNDSRKSNTTTSVQPNTTNSTSSTVKTPQKTAKANTSSDSDVSSYIIAVTEGRGHARGEVGIAAMDPRRPHLILCQISDTQRYTHSLAKMNVFNFVEAIVPHTFVEGGEPRKLFLDMLERFPTISINNVQRRHFSEQIGLQLIQQYCSKNSESVMVVLKDKFYALSAAAALLKYIEFTRNTLVAPRSLKVEYQGIEGTMIIDLDTANRLELVMSLSSGDPAHSLFGALKHCRTKGGLRLLRANILQPFADSQKISSRLTCVKELIDDPILFNAVEAAISQLNDAESLLSLCMHPPQQNGLKAADFQMKYTLKLKSALEIIPSLSTALADATSDYFCYVRENLQDLRFRAVLDRILLTINEGPLAGGKPSANNQHYAYFMIRTEINGLLDIARKTYSELAQDISLLVTELAEKYNLPLRLQISQSRGFHIQVTADALKDKELPSEFILVHRGKSLITCHTSQLVALDQRCQQSLDEIKLMANVLLFELLSDIRNDIACLFPLCEYIAELDVCITLAHVGASQDYVLPKFGQVLKLKEARHPILDATVRGRAVPNDVHVSAEMNFIILTGPNQSGKSIYIRQVALLQIMAQIGSYVPAKEATFRIADRVFSRIGFDDSIEGNASSLMVELQDMDFILRNLTPTSLVIVDELCRGTSIDEGSRLALVIAEGLLDSKAFVFFTTHFLILTKLQQMYYNVRNFHFEALLSVEERPTLRFTHRMLPGVTSADHYGIRLAELMGFPPAVLTKAKQFAELLQKQHRPQPNVCDLTSRFEIASKLLQRLAAFRATCWEDMRPFVEQAQKEYLQLPPMDEHLIDLLSNTSLASDPATETASVGHLSELALDTTFVENNPNAFLVTSNAETPVTNNITSANVTVDNDIAPLPKAMDSASANSKHLTCSDINSPSVQLAAEMLLSLQRSFVTADTSGNASHASQRNDNKQEGSETRIIAHTKKSRNENRKKLITKEQKFEQFRSVLHETSAKIPAITEKLTTDYYEWKLSKKKAIQTVAVASRAKSYVNPAIVVSDPQQVGNVWPVDDAVDIPANFVPANPDVEMHSYANTFCSGHKSSVSPSVQTQAVSNLPHIVPIPINASLSANESNADIAVNTATSEPVISISSPRAITEQNISHQIALGSHDDSMKVYAETTISEPNTIPTLNKTAVKGELHLLSTLPVTSKNDMTAKGIDVTSDVVGRIDLETVTLAQKTFASPSHVTQTVSKLSQMETVPVSSEDNVKREAKINYSTPKVKISTGVPSCHKSFVSPLLSKTIPTTSVAGGAMNYRATDISSSILKTNSISSVQRNTTPNSFAARRKSFISPLLASRSQGVPKLADVPVDKNKGNVVEGILQLKMATHDNFATPPETFDSVDNEKAGDV